MAEKAERDKTKGLDITNNVDDTVLGEEDLRDVCRELVTIRAHHYQLGLELGLPAGELEEYPQTIDQAFNKVVLKWLRQRHDVTRFGLPTWKRLVEAVKDPVGANNPALAIKIAANHPKFVKEISTLERRTQAEASNSMTDNAGTLSSPDGGSLCLLSGPPDPMLLRNMDTIQAKFVSLLQTVQQALEANEVLVANVYQFLNQWLITKYQTELDATCRKEFSVMFNCLTKRKVWTYDYHVVLEILTDKFLSESQAVKDQIKQYKNDLSGFFVAVKLIEYIKLHPFSAEELENEDEDATLPDLTTKQYRSLKCVLNLSIRKISQQSLSYVRNLWEKFTEEFDLPQLPTVIKKLVPGSLEISWIIWSSMAETILQKSKTPKAIKFFRENSITLVAVDDITVYDEQEMVKNESSFLEVCSLVPVDVTKLSALLDVGVDPNVQDKDGNTGIILVCSNGQKAVASLLIEKGAGVTCCDKSGFTSLHHASMNGFDGVVEMLLDRDTEIDAPAKDEKHCVTPLILASKNGHRTVVQLLITRGANINYTSKIGFTPLHYASLKGFSDVIEVLIDEGAEVDVPVKEEQYLYATALSLACRSGHRGVAKLLIQRGANVNYRDKIGFTPLHYASQNGHFNVVLLLLERDAQVDSQAEEEKNCTTALILACQSGHKAIAKLLIDKGANVDYQDRIGFTALHLASLKGDVGIVQLLINSGALIDIRANEEGNRDTALTLACLKGHIAVAILLLEKGSNINYRTKNGFTALHYGSYYGHTETVGLLLTFQPLIDIPSEIHNNPTALGLACMKGCTDIAKLLLSAGANVNFQDKDGNTPLHYASKNGFTKTVKVLVEHDAKIDVPSGEEFTTALMMACKNGHKDVAEVLIQNGADIDYQNIHGLTAYEIASMNLKTEICQLLQDYGYIGKFPLDTPHHGAKRKVGIDIVEDLPRTSAPATYLEKFRDVLEQKSSPEATEKSSLRTLLEDRQPSYISSPDTL